MTSTTKVTHDFVLVILSFCVSFVAYIFSSAQFLACLLSLLNIKYCYYFVLWQDVYERYKKKSNNLALERWASQSRQTPLEARKCDRIKEKEEKPHTLDWMKMIVCDMYVVWCLYEIHRKAKLFVYTLFSRYLFFFLSFFLIFHVYPLQFFPSLPVYCCNR